MLAEQGKGKRARATAAVDGLWALAGPRGALELAVMFSALWLCGAWGGDVVDPGLWRTRVQVQKEGH